METGLSYTLGWGNYYCVPSGWDREGEHAASMLTTSPDILQHGRQLQAGEVELEGRGKGAGAGRGLCSWAVEVEGGCPGRQAGSWIPLGSLGNLLLP